MRRKTNLQIAFQRGSFLTLKNPVYKRWFVDFLIQESRADIGRKGDITSKALLKKDIKVKAVVKTRESGIIAGLEEVFFLYSKNNILIRPYRKDGQQIRKGQILFELKGYQKDLLRVERLALDILQRMSGIATITKQVRDSINDTIPVAPTRKTHWRYLDKKAVFLGGGLTHRLALWESILIKDNHLLALKKEKVTDPIKTAIHRAHKKKDQANFIEIEVQDQKQALHAAQIAKELQFDKPFFIMLDNMPPKEIEKTIKELKEHKLYNHILLEASGGITPKNVKQFARSGVDVISMGYLTHFSPALDIKQEMV